MSDYDETIPGRPIPIRLLVVDKTAVLPHIRARWNRFCELSGFDVTLLTPSRWRENYRKYSFSRSDDDKFIAIPGRTLLKGHELKGFYLSGLRKAFKASSPDVVLMMEESFSIFGFQIWRASRRYAQNAPIIFYNNNIVSYELPGFRLARLYQAIGRRVTPELSLGLCVNDRALQVLAESGHGTRGRTLFYGIDEQLFYPPESMILREELRKKFALPASGTIVLYLGRMLRAKGIEDLIDAFARASEGEGASQLHLALIGSGPDERRITAHAADRLTAGSYSISSAIDHTDVPDLFRAVDAHVLPSRPEINEQFGRVNVEAMLSGVLAIGSRTGGIPEVIGEGGILYPPGDIDALSEVLTRLYSEPKAIASIRAAGRARALRLFSTEQFNRGLIEVISTLLA